MASRINGSKSGGPTSSSGKRRSSGNAVRHGALAQVHRPGGEPPELLEETVARIIDAVRPCNDAEHEIVVRVALGIVRQARIDKYLAAAGEMEIAMEDEEEQNFTERTTALRRIKARMLHHRAALSNGTDSSDEVLDIAQNICGLLEEVAGIEEHPEWEDSATRRLMLLQGEVKKARELLKYGYHCLDSRDLHRLLSTITAEQVALLDAAIHAVEERRAHHRKLRREMLDALPPEKAVQLASRYQRLIDRSLHSNLDVISKLRGLPAPQSP